MEIKNLKLDSSVKPVFADEVLVAVSIKQNKDEDSLTKDGNISLIFVDGMTTTAVTRVTLSRITAKALVTILAQNVANLEKELGSKKPLKKNILVEKTSSKAGSYFG